MKIFNAHQRQVAKRIDKEAEKTNWTDWQWQLTHSIQDVKTFATLLGIKFSEKELRLFEDTARKFPLSVTPYYLSLIDTEDYINDPVFKQSFPSPKELDIGPYDMRDPLHEDEDSPLVGITHRYPDRVLFHVSNTCSMYCRHCTRKRKVGDSEYVPSKKELLKGVDYIRKTPMVRDVLLSGGDALMLPDERLDWLLGEVSSIDHVEVVRIGTRMPVVLPYRITDDLVRVLKAHHPLWLNTHFNHPRELTRSSRQALTRLADAGIPLGNQSVLLAGVNDCPRLMRELMHKLVRARVRPYYIYQCDLSEGLSHFRTPVGKGMEIMESLRGHTSGFAVPTYVIDAPGGAGKIPVMPNYLLSLGTHKVVLRNFEGVITTYTEPSNYDPPACDRKCETCELTLKTEDADEWRAVGLEKLFTDWDDTESLTPSCTERMERRADAC